MRFNQIVPKRIPKKINENIETNVRADRPSDSDFYLEMDGRGQIVGRGVEVRVAINTDPYKLIYDSVPREQQKEVMNEIRALTKQTNAEGFKRIQELQHVYQTLLQGIAHSETEKLQNNVLALIEKYKGGQQ